MAVTAFTKDHWKINHKLVSLKIIREGGHDRIGDWSTEMKMIQEDGLYYYEDFLGDNRKVSDTKINLFISTRHTVHSRVQDVCTLYI